MRKQSLRKIAEPMAFLFMDVPVDVGVICGEFLAAESFEIGQREKLAPAQYTFFWAFGMVCIAAALGVIGLCALAVIAAVYALVVHLPYLCACTAILTSLVYVFAKLRSR